MWRWLLLPLPMAGMQWRVSRVGAPISMSCIPPPKQEAQQEAQQEEAEEGKEEAQQSAQQQSAEAVKVRSTVGHGRRPARTVMQRTSVIACTGEGLAADGS